MIYALWLLLAGLSYVFAMLGVCWLAGEVPTDTAALIGCGLMVISWITAEIIDEWESKKC